MEHSRSLLFALFISTAAVAVPDEAVIREMQRQTRLSADEIRANYDACDSGNNNGMIICGRYRWTAADIRLNRLYQQALAEARKIGHENSLVKSQRAWLAYRDALCAYGGDWGAGGGREESLYLLSCMEDVTRQRADYLKARLSPESSK